MCTLRRTLGFLVVVMGCRGSGGSPDAATVSDSAGVTIVASTGIDRLFPDSLTLQRRIGLDEDGVAALPWLGALAVGVDREDRIYLLNSPRLRVEVYDTSGSLLGTRGQDGGGPGEFKFPARLRVHRDGAVDVTDYAKSALVRFASDGTPRDEFSHQDLGFPYSGLHLDGDAVYLDSFLPDGKTSVITLQRKTPSDSLLLARLVNPSTPGMVQFGCVSLGGQPPVLSPSLLWTARDSLVAVAAGPEYRVDLFVHGHLVRSIRRAIVPTPATATDAHRLLPEGQRIGFGMRGRDGCSIPTDDLIEKLGLAPVVPTMQRLLLAPDGALWVQRQTFPDEPNRVDVFDADGSYLRTVTGQELPLGFLSGGRLLFSLHDEETGGYAIGIYSSLHTPQPAGRE